jgi:hypothetical protein
VSGPRRAAACVAIGCVALHAIAAPPADKPSDKQPQRVDAAAQRPAVRPERYAAPLVRLEVALSRQLVSKRRSPVVSWREAAVSPELDQLVWGKISQRVPGGSAVYRAAVDPRTRWYYVTRAETHKPVQFFGPLEELADGVFVDAFAAPSRANAP